LRDYTILLEGEKQIPVEDIREIRIVEQNTGKTVASYVFSTLGILAGASVVLFIILLLTKSSCPYVYVDDGEGFCF
jgi:type IV secretory pathway component VirB8